VSQPGFLAPLAILGLVVLSASLGALQSAAPPSATELLSRYDGGDPQAVATLLAGLPDTAFDPLKQDFEHVAGLWTTANGPMDERRRRLVAATLALEIVNARLQQEWKNLRSLIEFGCDLVRKNPPGDTEHLWQLASVALGEGSGDVIFMPGHIGHAAGQFPNDPRFRFAQAVVNEYPHAFDRRRRDAQWRTDSQLENQAGLSAPGAPLKPLQRLELDRRESIRAAAKEFLGFTDVPQVRGEAHARLGHAALLLRDPTTAITFFKKATEESDDEDVRYLGFFLAGQALEMLGRTHDAEMAYRQALAVIPNVQSGVEALATRLFLDGHREDAYALVQASFTVRPHPLDVWRLYAFGDYVRWPTLIERLRKALP
jgi:tetratricopeptide (TPR) repeat protein